MMGGQQLLTAVVVGLAIGSAQLANAADLPVPAPAPEYSWSGCYAGAQVGLGAMEDSYTETFPVQLNPVSGLPSPNTNQWGFGVLGGGQLGCNYQIGHFVFGVESDAWASSLRTNSNFSSFAVAAKASTTNPFDFDLAGRFGFAYDQFLFYGKAGFAFGSFNYNFTSKLGHAQAGTSSSPGIVLGMGLEYAIWPHWTVKGETDFLAFSASDVNLACNFACVGTGGNTSYTSTITATEVLFKIGANYKFW